MNKKKSCKIFFFGDSICFGQGVSVHKTWVSICSSRLGQEFPDIDFIINNPSINGNTTRMALERMSIAVQDHRPDILVVQFGMNDCNYWKTDGGHPRVSPKAYEANLEEIVDRAMIFGTKKIILHNNHTVAITDKYNYANIAYHESNIEYCDIVRKLSSRLSNVYFNDIEMGWKLYKIGRAHV